METQKLRKEDPYLQGKKKGNGKNAKSITKAQGLPTPFPPGELTLPRSSLVSLSVSSQASLPPPPSAKCGVLKALQFKGYPGGEEGKSPCGGNKGKHVFLYKAEAKGVLMGPKSYSNNTAIEPPGAIKAFQAQLFFCFLFLMYSNF